MVSCCILYWQSGEVSFTRIVAPKLLPVYFVGHAVGEARQGCAFGNFVCYGMMYRRIVYASGHAHKMTLFEQTHFVRSFP